jgi:hydrogenase nickel incorporation protein HypA/HybF
MHELSIASTVLERAKAASDKNGGARVTKIGLRIGEISGVDADALTFGIEALCKDTPMQGVVLEVERCKRKQRCTACATEFVPEGFLPVCPACRSDMSECIAGKELDVMFYELEDSPCA